MKRSGKALTARELERRADRYFAGISHRETVSDKKGEPLLNELGEPLTVTTFPEPPTLAGLCLFLGVGLPDWYEWCDAKRHPEHARVAESCYLRFLAYLQRELLVREKGLQGVTQTLENNCGWPPGFGSGRAGGAAGLSLSEKLALLNEAAEALAFGAAAGTDRDAPPAAAFRADRGDGEEDG